MSDDRPPAKVKPRQYDDPAAVSVQQFTGDEPAPDPDRAVPADTEGQPL